MVPSRATTPALRGVDERRMRPATITSLNRHRLGTAGLLLLLSVATGVSAQPAAPEPPAQPAGPTEAAPAVAPAPAEAPPAGSNADIARDHFKRGEAAYQKGNYPLAIQEWQTAYSSDPRPRIQYNIYQAHERLGQLGQAAEALQRYLSSADPDDPYYADATARMASLQQRLQATGIRLVGGVEGATINVSGHNWGRLPRPDRIPVQPGNHRVIVSLEGYRDFTSNVIVPAGQVVDVPIQLERVEGSDAPVARPLDTPVQVEEGPNMTPLYVVSGVLLAGAVGTLVWTINRNSELNGCDDIDFFCKEQDTVETQRTIALASTITLGVGAVGVLVYALVAGGDNESASANAHACVPTLTGATCRF
jgi:hypothetical protein